MITAFKFSDRIMREIHGLLEKHEILNRELAAEMGVSEARISQIFSERSNITLATVDRIHDAILQILFRRPPKIVFLKEFLKEGVL